MTLDHRSLQGLVGILGIVAPPLVYWLFFLGNENWATLLTGSRDNLPMLIGGCASMQFIWAFQEATSVNKWLAKNEQSSFFSCFGINSLSNMCALSIWLFSYMSFQDNIWNAAVALIAGMFFAGNAVRLLLTKTVLKLSLGQSINALKFVFTEEFVLYGFVAVLFLTLGGNFA